MVDLKNSYKLYVKKILLKIQKNMQSVTPTKKKNRFHYDDFIIIEVFN